MKLPEDPQLEDLTKEQLIHLIRQKFWMIHKRDLVYAIYEVESALAMKEMDEALDKQISIPKLKEGDSWEEISKHLQQRKVFEKKWERASLYSDKVHKWLEKQRKKLENNAQNDKAKG